MYEIKKNDKTFAVVEYPAWVYRLENGDLGLTDKEHATGISTPFGIFSLGKREDMQEYEQVVLNEVDGGVLIVGMEETSDAIDAQATYTAMVTGTLLPNEEEDDDVQED